MIEDHITRLHGVVDHDDEAAVMAAKKECLERIAAQANEMLREERYPDVILFSHGMVEEDDGEKFTLATNMTSFGNAEVQMHLIDGVAEHLVAHAREHEETRNDIEDKVVDELRRRLHGEGHAHG